MASALASSLPPQLKAIKPFILRSAEVENYALSANVPEQRRVAYYCLMHAMEKAVESAHSGEPAVQEYLMQLMIKLEKDKAELQIDAANIEHDKELVRKNALTIFKKADDVDRAGLADKSTARNFNVASNFFDVLTGMGDTDAELVQMRKYAQFKALDILRALKEGRQPTAGVPGADNGGIAVNNSPMPTVPDGTPTPTGDTEEDDVVLPGGGGGASSAPYPPVGGAGSFPPQGASAPPPYSAPSHAPQPYHPAPSCSPVPAPAPAPAHSPSPAAAASQQPPAPYVPPTRVPASEAAQSDDSACVAKGTRVHFRNDAMSDAWKLARHALRSMEMDDAATAMHYLQQAQTALGAAQ